MGRGGRMDLWPLPHTPGRWALRIAAALKHIRSPFLSPLPHLCSMSPGSLSHTFPLQLYTSTFTLSLITNFVSKSVFSLSPSLMTVWKAGMPRGLPVIKPELWCHIQAERWDHFSILRTIVSDGSAHGEFWVLRESPNSSPLFLFTNRMTLWSWHVVSEDAAFLRQSEEDLLLLFGALVFLVFSPPLLHPHPAPPDVEMVSLQMRSEKPVEDENNRLTFINIKYWIWKGLNSDTSSWG